MKVIEVEGFKLRFRAYSGCSSKNVCVWVAKRFIKGKSVEDITKMLCKYFGLSALENNANMRDDLNARYIHYIIKKADVGRNAQDLYVRAKNKS